jgi:hypothetical protein
MLDGVLASKLLRHIIVTQDITRAYLLARGVSPQKITLIYGGVMHARYVDEKAPIRAYYPKKPLLDVAFVAHKYMPQAPNKGFPDFCGLASNLAADPAIAWHVAGPVWVETDETGEVARRLVYRMQIERGVRTRFAVGYQIRDPDSGRLKDIVRYGDARGFFHRHNAGFPPGNDHIPINLPPGIDELEYIEADLDAHADEYEAEAVRLGYEVSEDDDETDP